ncbi:hypothetical protein [Bacillus sp. 179-C3.3 HS]|uniref:hypothetical protein n=1 Tax=Bacillus sp. 179-C3.3 HS TaxID=3232162 RepID=UPI00399F4B62
MEIIINDKQLDKDMVKAVEKAFKQIIGQLNELNLTSLQSIIVPNDFGEELIQFQRNYGLRKGYTNNEFGIAMGKVLNYIDNGEFKISVFFDPRIIYTLFSEEHNQHSVHIIHHEFCHVHDDSEKYNAFGVTDLEQLFFNTKDKVKQIAYAHADLIWSEYIATRLSSKSTPENHDFYIESILSLIPETKENCEEYILSYRIDNDIDKLFGEIQLLTSLLLKVISYFIGYCHCFNLTLPKDLNEIIRKYPYLDGVWEQLCPNLEKLYESYGNWESVEVFEDLSQTVLKLWNNLGVYPKNEDRGLYISVPF